MLEVTVKVLGIRFVGKSVIMWTFSKLNVHRPAKRMPKQCPWTPLGAPPPDPIY